MHKFIFSSNIYFFNKHNLKIYVFIQSKSGLNTYKNIHHMNETETHTHKKYNHVSIYTIYICGKNAEQLSHK